MNPEISPYLANTTWNTCNSKCLFTCIKILHCASGIILYAWRTQTNCLL